MKKQIIFFSVVNVLFSWPASFGAEIKKILEAEKSKQLKKKPLTVDIIFSASRSMIEAGSPKKVDSPRPTKSLNDLGKDDTIFRSFISLLNKGPRRPFQNERHGPEIKRNGDGVNKIDYEHFDENRVISRKLAAWQSCTYVNSYFDPQKKQGTLE